MRVRCGAAWSPTRSSSPCAVSMASTRCCPTTATSTAFRTSGSPGSACDRPMYRTCDCSLGLQVLVAVNSSPAAPVSRCSSRTTSSMDPQDSRRPGRRPPFAYQSRWCPCGPVRFVDGAGTTRTRKTRCPAPRGAILIRRDSKIESGNFTIFHLHFDKVELMTQLWLGCGLTGARPSSYWFPTGPASGCPVASCARSFGATVSTTWAEGGARGALLFIELTNCDDDGR